MAKTAQVPSITGSQAKYILEKLIDERKVTASDVRLAISGMWEEMSFIERRIAELRDAGAPLAHPVRAAKQVAKTVRKKARRISAKTHASFQLQGQYLGYMRQIPEREKAKFKAMAKKDGREKAVAAMKKRLGK